VHEVRAIATGGRELLLARRVTLPIPPRERSLDAVLGARGSNYDALRRRHLERIVAEPLRDHRAERCLRGTLEGCPWHFVVERHGNGLSSAQKQRPEQSRGES
jgi:hypothetical protein